MLATFNKNDAAKKTAEQQVIANAQSIAETVEPFYGTAAKEGFFKLLADHYGAVKAYLVASVADDLGAQSTAAQSLTSNAEEIRHVLEQRKSISAQGRTERPPACAWRSPHPADTATARP